MKATYFVKREENDSVRIKYILSETEEEADTIRNSAEGFEETTKEDFENDRKAVKFMDNPDKCYMVAISAQEWIDHPDPWHSLRPITGRGTNLN